jgi:hypothetical protein
MTNWYFPGFETNTVALLPSAEMKACSTSNRLQCCATSLFVCSTDLAFVTDVQDWLTNNRAIPVATATEIKKASATTGLTPILDLDVRPPTNPT